MSCTHRIYYHSFWSGEWKLSHFLDYLRSTCNDCIPVPPFVDLFSTLPTLLSSLPLKKREKSNFKKRGRGRLQRGLRVKVQIQNELLRKKLCKKYFMFSILCGHQSGWNFAPCLNYTNINRLYWHLGVQRRENWGRDRWCGWKIKTKSFFLT